MSVLLTMVVVMRPVSTTMAVTCVGVTADYNYCLITSLVDVSIAEHTLAIKSEHFVHSVISRVCCW